MLFFILPPAISAANRQEEARAAVRTREVQREMAERAREKAYRRQKEMKKRNERLQKETPSGWATKAPWAEGEAAPDWLRPKESGWQKFWSHRPWKKKRKDMPFQVKVPPPAATR